MRDFVAIDFETANYHHTSVCSVGIVIVRGGEIVEKYYSLIRPEPNWYVSRFTDKVHGISFRDTYRERVFPDVWAEIAPKIEGLPLVAHNKVFDEGCLKAAFELYEMAYPNYEFLCTLQASRQIHRHLPNHQLHIVAQECGFHLLNHHNAIADAEACAIIAIEIL